MSASFPAAVWDGDSADQSQTRHDDKAPSYKDWDRIVDEVIAVQEEVSGANLGVTAGTPNGTGVTASAVQTGKVVKVELTFVNVAISIASTAVGFGSLKIFDPAAGNTVILGATGSLTLSTVGADIDADADVIASVGSVACADDTTLTGTEANIVPSTAFTLVAGTKTAVVNSTAPVTVLDPDVYLNIVVQDVDRTDNAQDIVVNGTLTLTLLNLG